MGRLCARHPSPAAEAVTGKSGGSRGTWAPGALGALGALGAWSLRSPDTSVRGPFRVRSPW
ncbi:hypothetical protein CHELA20_10100 [Hyphomicrobiales bacterium]|nr:hypothetical protein CHELA20_10100 [Hyphomicrobiales bacterium]CAH1690529.1 hypothetical protein CHELA41_50328 [Hyphomicrobiales bacterium]